MANAKQCDICGAYYSEPKTEQLAYFITYTNYDNSIDCFELCHDCKLAFVDFIENRSNKKENK